MLPTHKSNRAAAGLKSIEVFKPSLPKFFELEEEMSPICSTEYPEYNDIICIVNFTSDFTSIVRDQLTEPQRETLIK